MDAFENVVASLFEKEGYWTRLNVKINLTKEQKKQIRRPTAPRWEIDVVAYKASENEILLIECKSYIDSGGVRLRAFNGTDEKFAKLFKLFNDLLLREVVIEQLVNQLLDAGFCRPNPTVKLCLVAGNTANESTQLKQFFTEKGWLLFDANWIKDSLKRLATSGYDNSIAAIVSKLLLRIPLPETDK